MECDSELSLLSSKFTQDYPPAAYPELMHKYGRPYTCLLIETHDDYFICVPFRSFIGHKKVFLFTGTAPIHPRAFARKYQYSTLSYFHDIMGIY